MSLNKEKSNNFVGSDIDESVKNEEDLLAYNSKYDTNIYQKEDIKEKENKEKNIRERLSGESTSFSQYSNISGYNLKNINILSKETDASHKSAGFDNYPRNYNEYQEKQRKMSSPLCCYFEGSDIYLSKIQKNIINLNNSYNFIKKDDFFNTDKNIFKNNNSSNDINNNNLNINLLNQNQNSSSININDKHINDEENIENQNNNFKRMSLNIIQIPYNNINRIQNNNIINNNFFYQNNNIQQQVFNINYINLNNFQNNQFNMINNNISKRKLSYNIEDDIIGNYFNNILNINNKNSNEQFCNGRQSQAKLNPNLFSYNEEQERFVKFDINKKLSYKSIPITNKNEKKPFDKKKGDWSCPECHNLNFAFRVICNRCKLPKPSNLVNKKGQ